MEYFRFECDLDQGCWTIEDEEAEEVNDGLVDQKHPITALQRRRQQDGSLTDSMLSRSNTTNRKNSSTARRRRQQQQQQQQQNADGEDNTSVGNDQDDHDIQLLRTKPAFVEEHKVPVELEDYQHQHQHQHHHHPLIYSAPTVESLGDEGSTLIRPYLTPRTHRGSTNASTVYSTATSAQLQSNATPHLPHTPPRSRPSPLPHRSQMTSSPSLSRKHIPAHTNTPSTALITATTNPFQPSSSSSNTIRSGKRPSKRLTTLAASNKPNKKDRDFQHDEDAMFVQVRTISIADRSAFHITKPPSLDEWQQCNLAMAAAAGGTGKKKISPSLQHLQLIHKLQSMTHIRQLAFSPSTGLWSDLFVRWWDDSWESASVSTKSPSTTNLNGASGTSMDSPAKRIKRDGRYRSIDPVQATIAALPSTPPTLSNKKHRLPMRSDVGFPNASVEEIQNKQTEIIRETEWEEASPRLIVLVTSDDLGTAVQEEYTAAAADTTTTTTTTTPSTTSTGTAWDTAKGRSTRSPISMIRTRQLWNHGGLQGIPWAGPELLIAKERNKHMHARGTRRGSENGSTKGKLLLEQQWKEVNRFGMLAPPLDSTYSATSGWRPRPFYDRPPGMFYALCCPTQLEFDVGNIEPLLCSLTLYSLTNHDANRDGKVLPPSCKVSEDFYFPAGDWNGRVDIDALRVGNSDTNTTMTDPDLLQMWLERKHKAIFSYNPLLCPLDNLYVVCQVYKVTHVDASAAYLAAASNLGGAITNDNNSKQHSLRKRIQKKFMMQGNNDKDMDDDGVAATQRGSYRASLVYDNFGTQFLTPLCFGIAPLLSTTLDEKSKWPNGETQTLPLYCFPAYPESQDEFCDRLKAIVCRQHVNIDKMLSSTADGSSSFTMNLSSQLSMVAESSREDKSVMSVSNSATPNPSSSTSTAASATSKDLSSPASKKKGVRKFLSPRRVGSKREVLSTPTVSGSVSTASITSPSFTLPSKRQSQYIQETRPVGGRVALFSSSLDIDFSQAMLFTPPEIASGTTVRIPDNATDVKKDLLPRVLVDVSGDSAIMMDPKMNGPTSLVPSSEHIRKRSSLIRLPQVAKPAAYVDVSEFREVLFLAPRPEKSFDVDPPPSYHSLLNLLYLYPRLLRLETSNTKDSKSSSSRRSDKLASRQRYSIRIRLVKSGMKQGENGSVEAMTKAMDSFHNPAPWCGPQMLNAVYTRIPGDLSKNESDDLKSGIPLKDEFKLRLPMILDGNQFLHFTLFSVDMEDDLKDESMSGELASDGCGIFIHPLAETTIPLSSSSTRDPTSGIKATTIIPNGFHRIKLGEFQLQLETRLVSSIHVSDPTVAAVLRDFPMDTDTDTQGLKELKLVANRSVISKQSSLDSIPDKVAYSSLFASASGSTLLGHFQPLLLMHLANFVDTGVGRGIDTNGKFLVENIHSLLEIMRRIKVGILLEDDPNSDRRLQAFIKSTIDAFDEGILQPSMKPKHDNDEDAASRSSNSVPPVESGGDDDPEEDFDGGAIRKRKKDSLRSGIDIKISRTFSAMEGEIPFSRVAYGASKTDRMRLEAELETDTARFTHLVDDDETVVTTATGMHSVAEARMAEARELFPAKWGVPKKKAQAQAPENPFVSCMESEVQVPSEEKAQNLYPKYLGDLTFAKRVRTAAQIILAPCVTPNLSTVFTPKNSSPKHFKTDKGASKGTSPGTNGANQENTIESNHNSPPVSTAAEYLLKPSSMTNVIFLEGVNTSIPWIGYRGIK